MSMCSKRYTYASQHERDEYIIQRYSQMKERRAMVALAHSL